MRILSIKCHNLDSTMKRTHQQMQMSAFQLLHIQFHFINLL